MTARQFTADELNEFRSLAAQWGKIVSKRAFGDDGPELDVDFRTMEQIAAAAAQGLTEGTLQHLLEQQTERLPENQPCPECGTLCPTKSVTRVLAAEGAEIQQVEPVAYCPGCRRDFFPPADIVGPG